MTKKDVIRILYPYIRGPLIAEYLDITVRKMYNFVWDIGLKKHPKFKHQMNSALATQAGERTRFKKGQVPHNKGIKCPNLLQTNAAKTMFKKGNKPHNTREEHATSIRVHKRDGKPYHYTKIKDGLWKLTHRVLWEKVHGEIPTGHVVRFKDGNSLNLSILNLECIPMKHNMVKNTIQRYPMELQQVMKLKSKLNKQINNGKKRNE